MKGQKDLLQHNEKGGQLCGSKIKEEIDTKCFHIVK